MRLHDGFFLCDGFFEKADHNFNIDVVFYQLAHNIIGVKDGFYRPTRHIQLVKRQFTGNISCSGVGLPKKQMIMTSNDTAKVKWGSV